MRGFIVTQAQCWGRKAAEAMSAAGVQFSYVSRANWSSAAPPVWWFTVVNFARALEVVVAAGVPKRAVLENVQPYYSCFPDAELDAELEAEKLAKNARRRTRRLEVAR